MTKTAEQVVAKALSEWFSLHRSETNPEVVKIVTALRGAGLLKEKAMTEQYTPKNEGGNNGA